MISPYKLELSNRIDNYKILEDIVKRNIDNNYSLVLCFSDTFVKTTKVTLNEDKDKKTNTLGHAIAIYSFKDHKIGFVENSWSKRVTIDILALFWMSYLNYYENRKEFDFPLNITLSELYTNKKYKKYFELFNKMYVKQKSISKFEIDIKMFFVPSIFKDVRTIHTITLTKIRPENMSIKETFDWLSNNCFQKIIM